MIVYFNIIIKIIFIIFKIIYKTYFIIIFFINIKINNFIKIFN